MTKSEASIIESSACCTGHNGSLSVLVFAHSATENPMYDKFCNTCASLTQGHLVLNRSIQSFPQIDIEMSGGKRMYNAFERSDHRFLTSLIYRLYFTVLDKRELQKVGCIEEDDELYFQFAKALEKSIIEQGEKNDRTYEQTLEETWKVVRIFPKEMIKRYFPFWIKLDQYY